MESASVIVLLTMCSLYVTTNGDGSLNDTCQAARSGAAGVCRYLDDCPGVLAEIVEHSLYPSECGSFNHRQIICCPLPPTMKPVTESIQSNRISAKKCLEYQMAAFDEYGILRCSITTVPLIVGGESALPKEFPHMALIGFHDNNTDSVRWACGGSLISEMFVLTAAHCIFERNLGYAKYVLLGELNYANDMDDAYPKQYNVIERIKHPNFRHPSKYNDIALLRLDNSVQFNPYIRPACLQQTHSIDAEKVVASGWGKIDYNKAASEHMQKVTLEIFTHVDCNSSYANEIGRRLRDGIVDYSQICAGSHSAKKDTCQGDSGGPIQIYHPSVSCMYSIVGITSFGKTCGVIGVPGVYTRVFAFLDWIENIVWSATQ